MTRIIYVSGVTRDEDGNEGSAGAGKDEVGLYLEAHYGFTRVALADPIKRMVHELYGFTALDLWGTLERKELQHARLGGLSVRKACQRVGGLGRELWKDTWSELCYRTIKSLIEASPFGTYTTYDPMRGVLEEHQRLSAPAGIVVTDLRHVDEYNYAHARGAAMWRIIRPVEKLATSNKDVSETDLLCHQDRSFASVLYNATDIAGLHRQVDAAMRKL